MSMSKFLETKQQCIDEIARQVEEAYYMEEMDYREYDNPDRVIIDRMWLRIESIQNLLDLADLPSKEALEDTAISNYEIKEVVEERKNKSEALVNTKELVSIYQNMCKALPDDSESLNQMREFLEDLGYKVGFEGIFKN